VVKPLDPVDRICFSLFAPVVCHGPGWADTVPKWLRDRVQMERLILAAKQEDMATDAELVIYLYTASLEMPFDHHWFRIYMHYAVRAMESEGMPVPSDFDDHRKPLDDYEEMLVKDLKGKIFGKQVREYKARNKKKRQTGKKEEKIRNIVQTLDNWL